jgi:hypothetical protein
MSGRPLSRKGEIGSAGRSFAVMSTAFEASVSCRAIQIGRRISRHDFDLIRLPVEFDEKIPFVDTVIVIDQDFC